MICGVSEQFGDGSPTLQLPTKRPCFMIQDNLPGSTKDQLAAWYLEAFNRWAAVCDLQTRRIYNTSDAGGDVVNRITVSTPQAAGWPAGVLADQRLPYQGGLDLPMRINANISWVITDGAMPSGKIDLIRTLCHEIGHFLGLNHFPTNPPPELLEPTISHTVTKPQPTESAIVKGWFGPSAGGPTPALKKIFLAVLPSPTAAVLSTEAAANVILSVANDPGAVSVAVKATNPQPPPTGGTGMLAKLLAIWQAIRAGDYLTALRLFLELLEARASGAITDAEFAAAETAMAKMPQC